MENYEEIVEALVLFALKATEKIKENYTIEHACLNYFFDNEALDIGINFIIENERGQNERVYYSLLSKKDGLEYEIINFLNKGNSLQIIVRLLFEIYAQKVTDISDFEIEMEQTD